MYTFTARTCAANSRATACATRGPVNKGGQARRREKAVEADLKAGEFDAVRGSGKRAKVQQQRLASLSFRG